MKSFINRILDSLKMGSIARNSYDFLKYITNLGLLWNNFRFRAGKAPDGLPVQPPGLAYLVCGQYDLEAMYYNGKKGAEWIESLLEANGLRLDNFDNVLDFGCGCGRVLRFWKDISDVQIFGTDYNRKLVEWCNRNLQFAQVSLNEEASLMMYPDNFFDLTYAISIFTHLPLRNQVFWMNELIRTLKPGGYLIITVHGSPRAAILTGEERIRFERGEPVVRGGKYGGTNVCGVYHPRGSIEKLGEGRLTEVDFIESGATDAAQDVYLLKKLTDKPDITGS